MSRMSEPRWGRRDFLRLSAQAGGMLGLSQIMDAVAAPRGQHHSAKAADGTAIYFETHGQRSKPAIFMGPHFYSGRTKHDDSFTDVWIQGLQQDFFLIVADYPRGMGRTAHPQGSAFSPDIAAEEYKRIADAAGVSRFGWLGYSFGGAMGVQVACRTNRVAALAVGGFPPLNAPFQQMMEVSTKIANAPPPLPKSLKSWDPGILWSAVGFYTPLTHWPERQEISKLTMPRMVFMGDHDAPELAGNLRAVEDELRTLGWQINWLEGQDHAGAMKPAVSLPVVRKFFRETL